MSDAPLNKLVAQINGHLERFEHAGPEHDEQRISVGLLLIAARDSVQRGKWYDWLKANINDQSVIVRRRLLWRMRPIRTENWQSNGKRTDNTRGVIDKAYTDAPRTLSTCCGRRTRRVLQQPRRRPSVLARMSSEAAVHGRSLAVKPGANPSD